MIISSVYLSIYLYIYSFIPSDISLFIYLFIHASILAEDIEGCISDICRQLSKLQRTVKIILFRLRFFSELLKSSSLPKSLAHRNSGILRAQIRQRLVNLGPDLIDLRLSFAFVIFVKVFNISLAL